ncbi:MAG: hypothetical protein COT90_00395 [Candidatus Diapherotrites archaeon CG10_big_fil_rev_8_21_14_0_10_31_34]|nr:MAG: hypothetical protein COT90_00395 [Candidatus Diapherotrites archaeon CG10_big_fil_rev_8_21_14_0_10_31_34]
MSENTFVLKLNENADVIEELKKFVTEQNISYGLFVSASGKIKECELISIEPKCGIAKNLFKGEYEVNAVSGKIEKNKKNEVVIHLRVSISSNDFSSKAGELTKGKSGRILEIGIRKIELNKIINA